MANVPSRRPDEPPTAPNRQPEASWCIVVGDHDRRRELGGRAVCEAFHKRLEEEDVGELIDALSRFRRDTSVTGEVRTTDGRRLGSAEGFVLDWPRDPNPFPVWPVVMITTEVSARDVAASGVLEDIPRWILERVLETGKTPPAHEILGEDYGYDDEGD